MKVARSIVSTTLALLALTAGAPRFVAAQSPWQPSASHTQIPLWPRGAPGSRPAKEPESSGTVTEACDWLTSKGITCVLLKYLR